MSTLTTPHNFLLYLRTHCPNLARRMDGISGLERSGTTLLVRAPEGSWSLQELAAQHDRLDREVRRFFGSGWQIDVVPSAPKPQALPFPVLSSKAWNHLAFLQQTHAHEFTVVTVRKPLYQQEWLPAWQGAGAPLRWHPEPHPEVRVFRYAPAAVDDDGKRALVREIPEILDDLTQLARSNASYTHLLMRFPGDDLAERIESCLYATKEWGTARTPGPILHKYMGRVHYVGPEEEILGFRVAQCVAEE